ncbi:DUF2249 domain-containing protein [Halobaculum rubrum]|uniref:DUF2249 domain-containing protein n=1 Tax=Halobaculum rubrum TaxID=2872158 RepID=UPI001CA38A4E|nr:DUF2249 domain-containing protein [Halobaculum rubrum]QZY00447.1 DUF2249 domain-containing protein [Halobaculum rubrum]
MAHADADGTGTDTGPATDTNDPRVLDVRDIDAPPFERITGALADLDRDETLVIVNSFDPEPLYGELDRRGFTHRSSQVAPDEWRVRVEHE